MRGEKGRLMELEKVLEGGAKSTLEPSRARLDLPCSVIICPRCGAEGCIPTAIHFTVRHDPHRELVSTLAPALGANHLLVAVLPSCRSSGHSSFSSALIMLTQSLHSTNGCFHTTPWARPRPSLQIIYRERSVGQRWRHLSSSCCYI